MILEKITKLLRLAERATGPEAELALMNAQKLATQHQIDLATVDVTQGETTKREEMTKGEVRADGKIKTNLICALAEILQDHFRVKVCWSTRPSYWDGDRYIENPYRNVTFVGRKSDTVFAEYLFNFLLEHFQREWKQELKRPGQFGRRRTQLSFYFGMAQGLNDKLRKAKIEAERDGLIAAAFVQQPRDGSIQPEAMVEKMTQKYQLALVNEADELAKAYREFVPRSTSYSGSRGSSMAAREAGYAAGQRTRIPGAPLNNSSRSSLN